MLSGFLLLRKRSSCAIDDCARLRRWTPYHGADRKRRGKQVLALLKSSAADIANKKTQSVKCESISAERGLFSVDASLMWVNSPATLLNEPSSSVWKTDKQKCLSVLSCIVC